MAVSANALDAEGLTDELNFAFNTRELREGRKIVPVRLDDTRQDDVDYRLSGLNWIELRSDKDIAAFEDEIHRFVESEGAIGRQTV